MGRYCRSINHSKLNLRLLEPHPIWKWLPTSSVQPVSRVLAYPRSDAGLSGLLSVSHLLNLKGNQYSGNYQTLTPLQTTYPPSDPYATNYASFATQPQYIPQYSVRHFISDFFRKYFIPLIFEGTTTRLAPTHSRIYPIPTIHKCHIFFDTTNFWVFPSQFWCYTKRLSAYISNQPRSTIQLCPT